MEARGGTKRQLFGIFLAFSESSHQMGPEKPLGARKSQKVAKWVTLLQMPAIAHLKAHDILSGKMASDIPCVHFRKARYKKSMCRVYVTY